MKVLVTAGGTTEKIDNVRGITNFSTGRLGSLVASELDSKKETEVIYVHGIGAILPESDQIRCIEIESTRDLANTLKNILERETIDFMVHSMAISDYYSVGTMTGESAARFFNARDEKKLHGFWGLFKSEKDKKISSKSEDLVVHLKKNPKVIQKLKEWSPQTKLVGFKLLVDVSEDELLKVTRETLVKNKCDFVLGNDKKTIMGDAHVGILIDKSGIINRFSTKQEIAKGIANLISKE